MTGSYRDGCSGLFRETGIHVAQNRFTDCDGLGCAKRDKPVVRNLPANHIIKIRIGFDAHTYDPSYGSAIRCYRNPGNGNAARFDAPVLVDGAGQKIDLQATGRQCSLQGSIGLLALFNAGLAVGQAVCPGGRTVDVAAHQGGGVSWWLGVGRYRAVDTSTGFAR